MLLPLSTAASLLYIEVLCKIFVEKMFLLLKNKFKISKIESLRSRLDRFCVCV